MKTLIKTACVAAAALALTAFTAPKAEAAIVTICPPVVRVGRPIVAAPAPVFAPRVVCAPLYPVVRFGWDRHFDHGYYFHRR